MERVHYRIEDRVAILTIDNPPVNALSAEVQAALRGAVNRAFDDSGVEALVIIGSGTTFVAGADIKQLERMAHECVASSILPEVLHEIENGPKPVVAAIHGNAFGGGLELAMAAHYRIASAGAKVGQPEVKLGLIPGAGGTQRLPRLAGVEMALEMCVFGEPAGAEDAQRCGVVDRIAQGELLTDAIRFAKEMRSEKIRRTSELGIRESNSALFTTWRERVRRTQRNLTAPAAAVDAVEAATTLPFDEGCRREREIFLQLLGSSQARALIHVFFAERAAAKVPEIDLSSATQIRSAAIVGAGTMGRGIAMCFANAGIPVQLKDTTQKALDQAMQAIEAAYESAVRKSRISSDEMRKRIATIGPQMDYAGFDAADVVIEAAFEDLEVKRAVFGELNEVASHGAILATNTSYLNIDEISGACARPERVIGIHFFSPAHMMRLLEIVPGKVTAQQVTATALALAKMLGKIAVVAGNAPGFIGNRMMRAYRNEAHLLVEEGASPRQVDSALESWGMAMGPFAVQDLAGIDIAMRSGHVFDSIDRAGGRNPRVMEMLYAAGRLGQKTNAGWYRYDESRNRMDDPAVEALIEQARREAGVTRRTISDEEIVERTIRALISEGRRILDEGHALRASDIDVVFVHGYGFPAYRGGPMHYADEAGLARTASVQA